ncbi:hypothetical protein [Massilia eburnea]|uniref:hypothetical protein n=1 Tax=Massilia eburnea TaxID=1776165 RepID=UPI003D6BEC98
MKQRNVQQQNLVIEEEIRRSANYWRIKPLPSALVTVATDRGVDCTTCVFLDLDIDYPGMPSLSGLLLTNAGRFIEFEIDTDASHTKVESVDLWDDVTDRQNLSSHNRGTGLGKGALAMKVLREFNSDAGELPSATPSFKCNSA